MNRIDRRTMLILAAGGAAIVATRAHAHDDHDHGAASPEVVLGTGTGAVYMTIRNDGEATDLLVSATTDVAREVQVHRSTQDGNVGSMEQVTEGLELPVGEDVVFEPGGLHLMLVDLTQNLLPDSTFTITLSFDIAGDVELTVPVVSERLDDVPVVEVGAIAMTGYWSRPAPMLSGDATPDATPKG